MVAFNVSMRFCSLIFHLLNNRTIRTETYTLKGLKNTHDDITIRYRRKTHTVKIDKAAAAVTVSQ